MDNLTRREAMKLAAVTGIAASGVTALGGLTAHAAVDRGPIRLFIDLPKGFSWPTLASVPLREGADMAEVLGWQLQEDGRPIPSYTQVIAKWPKKGTPKWLHVYAIFTGGKEYDLRVGKEPKPLDGRFPWNPSWCWKLLVRDHLGTDWGIGGHVETVELDTPVVRIERYDGPLAARAEMGLSLVYRTRVTRFAGHPLIRFSHSIGFSGTMRGHRIERIAFHRLNRAPGKSWVAGVDGRVQEMAVRDDAGEPMRWHQRRHNRLEPGGRRADGWFGLGTELLLVRDFWQKYPQAVQVDGDQWQYLQWFGKGREFSDEDRLAPRNLHKMYHWHHGASLDAEAPADWIEAFLATSIRDYGSSMIEDSRERIAATDMQGMTIHDDFAFLDDREYGRYRPEDAPLINEVWQRNPVGVCHPKYVESTEVVDTGARGEDFGVVEQFLEDSLLGFTNPARHEDYGRFLWGDSHRDHRFDEGRPVLHRVNLGSYYSAGETYWRMRLRGGSEAVLQLARHNAERYRSILQTSYGREAGEFWYGGLWFRDRQKIGRAPDPDCLLWSWLLDGNRHHKDGYDLWLTHAVPVLPGPVTAGTGREQIKNLTSAVTAYEYRPTTDAYTYYRTLRAKIAGMAAGLRATPLARQLGALWHPEWCKRALRYDAMMEEFVAANYQPHRIVDTHPLDLAVMRYDATGDSGFLKENLLWIRRQMDKIYRGDDPEWMDWLHYGVGVGPLGFDAWLKLQWPAFLKRLRRADIEELPEDTEPLLYPWSVAKRLVEDRFAFSAAVHWGTEVLLIKDRAGPLVIRIDSIPTGLTGGDVHPPSVWVLGPSFVPPPYGNILRREEEPVFLRLIENLNDIVPDPPGVQWRNGLPFERRTLRVETSETGLFRVMFSSNAFPLYQRLSEDYPEALLFKPYWDDPLNLHRNPQANYWWGSPLWGKCQLSTLQFPGERGLAQLSIESAKADNQTGGFIRFNGMIDMPLGRSTTHELVDGERLMMVAGAEGIARIHSGIPFLCGPDSTHLMAIRDRYPGIRAHFPAG